jgi:hypothetical protein
MKNKFSTILCIGISLFSHAMHSGVTVYLYNNYGAMLNYVISSQQPEGYNIANNVPVSLGDVNYIATLSVRTVGYLSYGSAVNLNPYLIDIRNQQAQHTNDDAIITIGSSGYMSNWNISLRWEPKGKIKSFKSSDFASLVGAPKVNPNVPEPIQVPAYMINSYEQEEAMMNLNSADQRLDAIKRGALGADYAKKATEVCSADYTQARKLGKIDLCADLKRNLMAPVYRIDKRVAKKKGFVSPDLAPAVEDIKRSITRAHNALTNYKARGEAS